MADAIPFNDALINPQVGDYWRHGSYGVIVVKVTARLVWTLEARDGTSAFIQRCEVHQWSRDQFNGRMRKGGMNDFSYRPTSNPRDDKNMVWAALVKRNVECPGWYEEAATTRPFIEHGKTW